MSTSSKTKQERLEAILEDRVALLTIGYHTVKGLLDSDRVESYVLERGTVRTQPVRCGEHNDVQGGE